MIKYNIFLMLLLLAYSCKKNSQPAPVSNYTLDQSSVTLNYDQQHQFSLSTNIGTKWKVSDTTIGQIDANGLFRAKKIGTDTVTASGQNFRVTAIVTIAPYYQLFKEPYFVQGVDTNAVKAQETRVFSGKYESFATGEDILLFSYKGENSNVVSVTYGFNNKKLVSVSVYLTGNNDLSYVPKLMTFYRERYPLDAIANASHEIFYGPYYAASYETINVDAQNLGNIKVEY